MIITQKKPIEELMAMIGDAKKIAIIGCASCAQACATGGEAQVAELKAYLEDGVIRNSVNFPSVDVPRSTDHRLCVLHRNIPNMLTGISGAVSAEGINIETMTNRSKKDYAYTILDVVGDPSDESLDKIRAIDGVIRLRKI